MKSFLKILLVVLFVVFLGWAYIMYLYLHTENKKSLDNIKDDFEEEVKKVGKLIKKEKILAQAAVSKRESEMIDFIKSMKKEGFELKEIGERFNNVSERTLRRDMSRLEKLGLVQKSGSTKNSRYKIKG